ncbi:hypothetical protein D3C87_574000 [compost metagenome]
MAIEISYFDSYEFKPIREDWEFVKSETPLDEFFTFNDYHNALDLAVDLGLDEVFEKIIPYIHSLDSCISVEEKINYEKLLIPAAECIRINEETGLISKILKLKPEWQTYFTSILNNWKKNRYVIIHYC